MKDIMKKVKFLQDFGFFLKGFSEENQNEAKKLKEGFRSMLLGILGANLLGDMLSGRGITRAGYGSKKKKRNYKSKLLI